MQCAIGEGDVCSLSKKYSQLSQEVAIDGVMFPYSKQDLFGSGPNAEQVSAFLGALHGSNVMRRALILCPATVLSHWMAELHVWAPQLRVVLLHRCVQAFNAVSGSSGTGRA